MKRRFPTLMTLLGCMAPAGAAIRPSIVEPRLVEHRLEFTAKALPGSTLVIEGMAGNSLQWKERWTTNLSSSSDTVHVSVPANEHVELFRASLQASKDLRFLNAPLIVTSSNAPLACVLEVSISEPARLYVEAVDASDRWRRDFFNYTTNHSIPLFGFKPGKHYDLRVVAEDYSGKQAVADAVVFQTAALPVDFIPIETVVSRPEKMEPGFTLFVCNVGGAGPSPFRGYPAAVDERGEVVWYTSKPIGTDVRQLPNGNLFWGGSGSPQIAEMDFLGNIIRSWDSATRTHHDAFPTRHGTIITFLTAIREVDAYPTSETNPNAPRQKTKVLYDVVREISWLDGSTVNEWHLFDMLEPFRLGYDSLWRTPESDSPVDWSHGNSVYHDPTDDTLMVSLRHQDAIVKFSRSTGKIVWIFSNPSNWSAAFQPYLFHPVEANFAWPYHQHAATITRNGTLLLFDNGNYRASPPEPAEEPSQSYSRAAEFELNVGQMTVRKVWSSDTSGGDRPFSWAVGDADSLPITGNILTTFGWITHTNGVPFPGRRWYPPGVGSPDGVPSGFTRIIETTHTDPAEVVFELVLSDPRQTDDKATMLTYRSDRFFDFYAKGDVNLDGKVDAFDRSVVELSSGSAPLGGFDPRDLDRDGTIGTRDLELLGERVSSVSGQ